MKKNYEDQEYWATRLSNDERLDWRVGEMDWIQGYWMSSDHPHRQLILDVLKKIQFKSLLELGCNIGPNLHRIREEFITVGLAGVDINKAVIQEAKYFSDIMDSDIKFGVGNISKLKFENNSFDVILIDAVLLYVDPKMMKKVMKEIDRVVKKTIILVEWYNEEERLIDFHWSRNYTKLLENYGFRTKSKKLTSKTWPSKSWQQNGRIFVGTR